MTRCSGLSAILGYCFSRRAHSDPLPLGAWAYGSQCTCVLIPPGASQPMIFSYCFSSWTPQGPPPPVVHTRSCMCPRFLVMASFPPFRVNARPALRLSPSTFPSGVKARYELLPKDCLSSLENWRRIHASFSFFNPCT